MMQRITRLLVLSAGLAMAVGLSAVKAQGTTSTLPKSGIYYGKLAGASQVQVRFYVDPQGNADGALFDIAQGRPYLLRGKASGGTLVLEASQPNQKHSTIQFPISADGGLPDVLFESYRDPELRPVPPGTEVMGEEPKAVFTESLKIRRKKVLLPEGKWELLWTRDDQKTTVANGGAGQRGHTTVVGAMLAKIDKGMIVATLTLTATAHPTSTSGWTNSNSVCNSADVSSYFYFHKPDPHMQANSCIFLWAPRSPFLSQFSSSYSELTKNALLSSSYYPSDELIKLGVDSFSKNQYVKALYTFAVEPLVGTNKSRDFSARWPTKPSELNPTQQAHVKQLETFGLKVYENLYHELDSFTSYSGQLPKPLPWF